MHFRQDPPSSSTMIVSLAGFTIGGCDPVINIGGANFPGWLLCAIAGIILAALMRPLFIAAGVEPYMGPPVLIYPSLATLMACITWLLFFNRI